MCSRSGLYNSKSTGERQLKAQGSKKAGCHCNDQTILKEFKDHLVMKYFKIHYKHDFLLSHLSVSKQVKQKIAGKLLLSVKENRIFRDVRSYLGMNGIEERHHILTHKDITNIKNSVGSTTSFFTPFFCDEISLHVCIKDMKEMEV